MIDINTKPGADLIILLLFKSLRLIGIEIQDTQRYGRRRCWRRWWYGLGWPRPRIFGISFVRVHSLDTADGASIWYSLYSSCTFNSNVIPYMSASNIYGQLVNAVKWSLRCVSRVISDYKWSLFRFSTILFLWTLISKSTIPPCCIIVY